MDQKQKNRMSQERLRQIEQRKHEQFVRQAMLEESDLYRSGRLRGAIMPFALAVMVIIVFACIGGMWIIGTQILMGDF